MTVSSRRHSRRLVPVALALGVTTCLSACAEGAGAADAASASTPATSSASESPSESPEPTGSGEPLLDALLPAEAFGPDANVVTVSVEELATAAPGQLPPGASIEPAQCAQGVGATQVAPDDFGTIVAQTATTPAHITVEVLAEGGQAAGQAPAFDQLLAECPRVTVTSPDGSTVTLEFAALEVPALGDGSGGLAMTIAMSAPDGTNLTVPSLLATAVDGERVVFLQRTGSNAQPLDQSVFTDLFEQAFQAQSGA
ncbi:hypothetical protein OF117_15955 [Geodermatophilus sp. YIM 151500]|uniref:hypothetical protein n=1 Tax=Geodermatophilus sp. YIM 151500 TaxID=2984531 RepID=UPI0021E3D3EA|nr:hypothetical protein [Geodermatophilus sp. YIM 151500]MCV2490851.1 hypothetical protein [Geodermatophilus sp. YIM 151500]